MKRYIVCGEEQGDIKDFNTIEEALDFIEELKRTDEEVEYIEDSYYVEINDIEPEKEV